MIEDDSVVDYLVAKGTLGNFSKRYEIEKMMLDGNTSFTSFPNIIYPLDSYFSQNMFIKREMSQIIFNELVSFSFS